MSFRIFASPARDGSPGRGLALLALASGVASFGHDARAQDASTSVASASGAEGAAAAELREVRRALEDPDGAKRKDACARADALPLPLVDARLTELAGEKDDGWDGAFRRAAEAETRGASDVVDDVAQGANPPSAIETVCLLRGAARTKQVAGMHVLVHHTADHRSSFRPLITRFLRDSGDLATPALIRARKEPVGDTRRWAWNTLEEAKKRLPGDAVQTKDYAVLAEILRVFAELRDQDAVPVIAAFVNSDRTIVRVAARQALLDYGQGALWKLRETYSNLLGTQALENWKAEEVAERLYKALDKIRLEDVYVLLDEGLELGKAGDVEGALQRFDQALAREPLIDRRGETARYYYLKAKSIREADRAKARSLLEKARFIGPPEAEGRLIESELALLDGLESVERGAPNASRFEEAIRLDPANERARGELAKLKQMVETRSSKARRFGIAACLLAAAVAVAFLFGGRRAKASENRG